MSKYLMLTLYVISMSVSASKEESRYDSWSFYMDNDMLSNDFCEWTTWCPENKDRAYTGGFGVGFKYKPDYKPWFYEIHSYLQGGYENINDGVAYDTMGLTVFTPDDLSEPNPIQGDRPYSSILFYTTTLAFDVTGIDDTYSNAIRSQLTFSILGAELGSNLQEFIHCDWGAGTCPIEGWDNNINDDWDVAVSYGKSYIYQLYSDYDSKIELIGEYGFNVGLYNEVNAGLILRIGRISSPYYSFNEDPFSTANKILANGRRENFAWLSIKGHHMIYNALLQGWHINSDSGPIEYDSDEIENNIISSSLGWTFPIAGTKQSSLTIKFQKRSSELKTDLSKDHSWGGLYFTHILD